MTPRFPNVSKGLRGRGPGGSWFVSYCLLPYIGGYIFRVYIPPISLLYTISLYYDPLDPLDPPEVYSIDK